MQKFMTKRTAVIALASVFAISIVLSLSLESKVSNLQNKLDKQQNIVRQVSTLKKDNETSAAQLKSQIEVQAKLQEQIQAQKQEYEAKIKELEGRLSRIGFSGDF